MIYSAVMVTLDLQLRPPVAIWMLHVQQRFLRPLFSLLHLITDIGIGPGQSWGFWF